MGDARRELMIHAPQKETSIAKRLRPTRAFWAYLVSAMVAVASAYAFSPRSPASLPATGNRADRLMINGLAKAGERIVAVGEVGTILLSDDQGRNWRTAQVVPQRHSTLTAVSFSSDRIGIAVGWDGWALRTDDGGSSWRETMYEKGRSEPLLAAWADSGGAAYALGSYGRFFESTDGGETWKDRALPVDERHLNGMAGKDNHLMLVGEQGTVLRSADRGITWEKLSPFFGGSLFGIAAVSARDWIAYGMRGNVFVTHDFGTTWKKAEIKVEAPFYGHAIDVKGVLLIVGAGGLLLMSRDAGTSFEVSSLAGKGTMTAVVPLAGGRLIVGDDRGVASVEPVAQSADWRSEQ